MSNALRHGGYVHPPQCGYLGTGNICRKQVVKGLLYLAVEILFIAFMVISGFGLLGGLTTLGTNEGAEKYLMKRSRCMSILPVTIPC